MAEKEPINVDKIVGLVEGYYLGKVDEIDEEIAEVTRWPQNLRIAGTIERKDQKLKYLNEKKTELEHYKDFVVRALKPTDLTAEKG